MRTVIQCLSLAFLAACSGDLVSTEVALTLEDPAAVGSGLSADGACAGDALACTPTDVSGRLFAGGVMWGELGPDAFHITMLGNDEEVILDPSSGMGGEIDFSMMDADPLMGQYAAPDRGDDRRPITRMELLVDYLDVSFTLSEESPLAGDWVIRTVLVDAATAPDVQGEMLRGDRLIKPADSDSFWWCDKDACSPSLDALGADPVGDPDLAEATPTGEGNPHYTPVTVALAEPLSLTGDALNTDGSAWTVAFDATDALELRAAPAELDGPAQLLSAVTLARTGEGDTAAIGLSADVRFTPGE